MPAWLDPLAHALDGLAAPLDVFFRDDDGGWEDGRLAALIDLFDLHVMPLDVAVIPQALEGAMARELRARAAHGRLGLHQHGFRHENHEAVGRKCEFGPSRADDVQRHDIACGKARLETLLKGCVDPIFTPPWNRCTPRTPMTLAVLGFRALSRDATATPLQTPGLTQIPVAVDWCKWRGDLPLLGETLAREAKTRSTLGVMLHHAVMDDNDRCALEELLSLFRKHPSLRPALMREVGGIRSGFSEDCSPQRSR